MRKILIIPEGSFDEHQQMAINNEIGEIIEGIPLGLAGSYTENDLPVIHIEDDVVEPPTEIELLGQQLVDLELQNLDIQRENQSLGQQMVDIDLRLLQGGI